MTETAYEYKPTVGGVPVLSWTKGVPVAENAREQLRATARLPFVGPHVAAMPDVHLGYGATVGSVIPTERAVVPAAVGVDIGCGMMATRLDLVARDLPDDLGDMRSRIEAAVPHGRTDNGGPNDKGSWQDQSPEIVARTFEPIAGELQFLVEDLPPKFKGHKYVKRAAERAMRHLGTLGTGNHFIEVCLDEKDRVWVMLHSGSRGIGNALGRFYTQVAKKECESWFIQLPNPELAYLTVASPNYRRYLKALYWAQGFAWANRLVMMGLTIKAVYESLSRELPDSVEDTVHCHHNYAAFETHYGKTRLITRKGAVRAEKGDMGIILGSMGARSFIVRGKGNPKSFNSCSHGAGRVMSRTEARKTLTLEDHEVDTDGIECRKDEGVLDESPQAYKPIDSVMKAQADLVEIVEELYQVVCVKG